MRTIKKILLTGAILVVVPVIAVVCLVGWDGVTEIGSLLGIFPPLRLKLPAYLRVISAIQGGELKAKSSIVILPSSYQGLTPNNQVLCEYRKDGRLWVLFPTWHGRGADVQGYLYSSGPLTGQDFVADGEVDAFGLDFLSVQKINHNWYRVMRRMG